MKVRTKREYGASLMTSLIEKPFNQHWNRFLPPQLVQIGDTKAVALEPVTLRLTYEDYKMGRNVRLMEVDIEEKKISFFMQNGFTNMGKDYIVTIQVGSQGLIIERFKDEAKARDFYAESLAKYPKDRVDFMEPAK